MKLKKVYIEITNTCNLNCNFCIKNQRKNQTLTIEEFSIILDKIKSYTDYIYLHVLGEPLLHREINEFMNLAKKKGFNINITTNGYLIDKIKTNKNIRQLNISVHSYDEKYNISLDDYLKKITDTVENLIMNGTKVSLRIWIKNKNTKFILNWLNNKYNTNITIEDLIKGKNIILKENLYLNTNEEFIWPDLNNNYYNESGKCYGLIDHIGILVDGTVIPCCLDSLGIINLGNIFNDDLDKILNEERANKIKEGFKNNKKVEELCKHCKFL